MAQVGTRIKVHRRALGSSFAAHRQRPFPLGTLRALLLPLVVHHHNRLLHQCTKRFMAVLDGEYLCLSDD